MTVPPEGHDVGINAVVAQQVSQILSEQGKQSTQLAVIGTKLDTALTVGADHELRIRSLETGAQQASGGRDVWSRVIAGIAVAAAGAATVADYLHH